VPSAELTRTSCQWSVDEGGGGGLLLGWGGDGKGGKERARSRRQDRKQGKREEIATRAAPANGVSDNHAFPCV